jgi:hypothetical protein
VQNADSSSLFDELDAALQSGSSEKRVAMLRQVTDLFLNEADRLNDAQIDVFDGVLVQLIDRIEARALVEISERLGRVANAPIDVTLNLARRSEIGIARPILTNSSRLTTADLVEIAKTSSQDHLLAISERAQIEPAVTDVLLDHGNRAVVHSVAGNSEAKFSEHGFAALLEAGSPVRPASTAHASGRRGGPIPIALPHASRTSAGDEPGPDCRRGVDRPGIECRATAAILTGPQAKREECLMPGCCRGEGDH